MRKSIDTYVQSIAHDNALLIIDGGFTSIADYIITSAENCGAWSEYFDDSEIEENGYEPTSEQIAELAIYLNENYNYLPEE